MLHFAEIQTQDEVRFIQVKCSAEGTLDIFLLLLHKSENKPLKKTCFYE